MYFQPYGNGQQLNLNWIINEIIELHKQLDPEYETPSFSQIYPYSNLNQLNLDWILSELKTLKELAPEPTPELDIQAVAEALVALPFDSTKSYQIFDYISRDGEIWRATEAIPAGSAWDGSKWFKTKLGTDLSVLERWINAINASLTTLENTVDELSSADISDDSDAGGATVKASLNNLKGSLNTAQRQITANIETSTTASKAYSVDDYLILNGVLYRVTQAIANGGTITINTNVTPTTATDEYQFNLEHASFPALVIRKPSTWQVFLAGLARQHSATQCLVTLFFPFNVYNNAYDIEISNIALLGVGSGGEFASIVSKMGNYVVFLTNKTGTVGECFAAQALATITKT